MGEMKIRQADGSDVADTLRVVEGALLEIESETVRERVADGDVLVADIDGAVVGALVLDTGEDAEANDRKDAAHVDAIAVTPQRRGQGIGRALVDAAATEHATLTADFRADVRAFWEACGFDVRESERAGRFRGRRDAE